MRPVQRIGALIHIPCLPVKSIRGFQESEMRALIR